MVENTKEISRWRDEINALIAAQQHMYGGKDSILGQLQHLYGPVMKDLERYRKIHNGNKEKLRAAIANDKAILAVPLKGPNKKHLKAQQDKARPESSATRASWSWRSRPWARRRRPGLTSRTTTRT